MKSKIKLFFSLVALLTVFASCEKELSEENGSTGTSTGTSTYTYLGAQTNCTAPVINSSYTVGTAVTSANTVELQVNVTKTGTYSTSTPKINGLTFSGSGTFVATGLQTIILTASGTPVVKGTFPYSPGFNGCSFSIPVVAAGAVNTAVFTFPSAPNACTAPVISGTYMADLALTSANTVKLQVQVTTAGAYTISTAAADGISFTGSGTFATTGLQTITLTGSGKPVAAGPFNFSPGTNGCSFSITVTPAAPPAVFTLQNNAGTCTTPVINGTYAVSQALTSLNTVSLTAVVTTAGSYNISTNTANGITFSASGLFTATGSQQIILTGTGTPLTEGTDLFTPVIPAGACAFAITTTAAIPVTDGTITCKVDGVAKTFNVQATATLESIPAAPPAPAFVDLDIHGLASSTSDESLDLELDKAAASFSNGDVFNPGSLMNGLIYGTFYTDAADNQYSAISGTALTPFTITLTSITATRAKGTFSGTMSDTGAAGGTTRTFTEGTFDVPIQ